MNRRVPNGTHGGVRGRKSPLETFSYSINYFDHYGDNILPKKQDAGL